MNLRVGTDRNGIALIIVLVIIVAFGFLAAGFALSMKVETKLARNASRDAEFEWAGRSGIELARWILAVESSGPGGQVDSLKAYWAGGPGETNGLFTELVFPMELGGAQIDRPKIVDLDRKFNINMADETILRQALTLVGVDAAGFPTIVDSILDWRDEDLDPHLSGTESDYYQTLSPPYFAKDGPLDDITELLLVRDVTPAMFWGSAYAAHRPAVLNRPSATDHSLEEQTYAVGLVDLFTTLSRGPININTASPTALQIFPEIDENIAQLIISGPAGRAGPDGADGTDDDTPFRSVADMARIPGINNPNAIGLLNRYFTARSSAFEVHVTVRIDNISREYIATVTRGNNPRDAQVLTMYWK